MASGVDRWDKNPMNMDQRGATFIDVCWCISSDPRG